MKTSAEAISSLKLESQKEGGWGSKEKQQPNQEKEHDPSLMPPASPKHKRNNGQHGSSIVSHSTEAVLALCASSSLN